MKKLLYAIPVLGMLISSCASDEPVKGNGSPADVQVTNYLTVNIVPTLSPGTRAYVDGDNTDNDKQGNYEDGTDSENQVNSIRFFFFDGEGNGAPVSVVTEGDQNKSVSYIDWIHYDSELGAGDEDITVEATVTATLGLTIPDNVDTPEKLIAVINPSPNVTGLTGTGTYGPTIGEVQNALANYEAGLTDHNFVMSNSVYVNTASTSTDPTVNYTSLVPADGSASYFQNSIEAAQANPVTVYVERVVARLDLKIGIPNPENGYYPVLKKVDGGQDMQVEIDLDGDGVGEKIYVKFLGWNVTTTPDKSYLVKKVNPNWTSALLFGATSNWLWNSMDFHRSFWAINPETFNYQYGNFGLEDDKDVEGNFQPAQANPMPTDGAFASTYMLENASPYDETPLNPSHPTQVILAAQLVTENGTPVRLAEWGYNKYTQDGLLAYLVNNIISKGNFWKQNGDNSYVQLDDEDLTYISAAQRFPGETLPENVESYYSYVVVKTTNPATKWFQWNGVGEEPTTETLTEVTDSDINQYILNNVGYTMMWNNGYTYYYFDVKHLGEENSPAFYGVVRNHVYQSTVTSLYGFGTPVCDPREIIIPEAPKYEEVILTAEIKILQWRVVSSNYTLEWR
ncbi:MAG: Mfa1 fimbrilin C-terminal domain-containing protein [Muribaculaceae bacterium]|nr:Mfa1 fimbrilin C-terminal domain-containing protein [Muribaculaceae bacterium]